MELLLTVEQAAQRLNLNPVTVQRQLKRGALRGIKRGRVWRIPESALFETAPRAQASVPETPLTAPNEKPTRRAAIEAAFGMFAGRLSSEAFLADKHAEAQREKAKDEAQQVHETESLS